MVDVVREKPQSVETLDRSGVRIEFRLTNSFCQEAETLYSDYEGEATKLHISFSLVKSDDTEENEKKDRHIVMAVSEALDEEFDVKRRELDHNSVTVEKRSGARITTEDTADILSTLLTNEMLRDDFGFKLRGDFYDKCAYGEHPFVERDGEDVVFKGNHVGGWTSFDASVREL